MKQELQQKLRTEFPWLGRCEIYCGDGWYSLLSDLCREIADTFTQRGVEITVIPTQIKQKFGGLRFYYAREDTAKSVCAVVDEIIKHYEAKSLKICEFCGGKARERADNTLMTTACQKCFDEHYEEFAPLREAWK